ncbi:MAG: helix-turn-helix domain-containing protein [Actinomycetota bacterium]
MVDRTELGRRLHMLRWGRWTLLEVQRATGVPQSNISRWERAEGKEYPPTRKLAKLAEFYEIKVAELFDPDFDMRAWFDGQPQGQAA